jgi:hypothetical protein
MAEKSPRFQTRSKKRRTIAPLSCSTAIRPSPVPYLLPVCYPVARSTREAHQLAPRLCHVRPGPMGVSEMHRIQASGYQQPCPGTTGRQVRRQPRPRRAAGPAGRPPGPGPAPRACRSISAPVNITSQPAPSSRDAWPHRPTPARSRAPPAYFSTKRQSSPEPRADRGWSRSCCSQASRCPGMPPASSTSGGAHSEPVAPPPHPQPPHAPAWYR